MAVRLYAPKESVNWLNSQPAVDQWLRTHPPQQTGG